MDPKTRQQLLLAVIVVCLIAIAYWWYQSQYGPGGRNKYGIIQVSWKNSSTAAGFGDLVFALDRSPGAGLAGGKVSSITAGFAVQASTTLPSAGAKTVQALLPKNISSLTISSVDASGNTVTFKNVTAPTGWPGTAVKSVWSTTTKGAKTAASASINVIPAQKGS
jgi:hypothetical protein